MPESTTVCEFSILILKEVYDVLKSESPCILLNKNINLNKKKKE